MKVTIHNIRDKQNEQIIIECVTLTPEIEQIRSYALAKGKELSGLSSGQKRWFRLEDVLYFEAVDEHVFACTQAVVYELKTRLYELEEAYVDCHFIRISKSVLMNLMLLEGISPALNGRFYAQMNNGERLMVSRQYVPAMKDKVTGGRRI